MNTGQFFTLWFCGNKDLKIRPYYMLSGTDWYHKNDKHTFSKGKTVMEYFLQRMRTDEFIEKASDKVKGICSRISELQRNPEYQEPASKAVSKIITEKYRRVKELFDGLHKDLLVQLYEEDGNHQQLCVTTVLRRLNNYRKKDGNRRKISIGRTVGVKQKRPLYNTYITDDIVNNNNDNNDDSDDEDNVIADHCCCGRNQAFHRSMTHLDMDHVCGQCKNNCYGLCTEDYICYKCHQINGIYNAITYSDTISNSTITYSNHNYNRC
jgi:hypothetical protein